MFGRRLCSLIAATSMVAAACSSGGSSSIGSFEVDDTAVVWGGQSIEETITSLRAATGPTNDVNAALATIGPIAALPELSDTSVEGVEAIVACTTPLFEECEELNTRTTAWISTTATAAELQDVLVESESFPSLADDLVPGGLLEPTFTETAEGDLVEIHAEPDGAVGQFKVRQLVEGVSGQIELEIVGELLMPLFADDTELRSVLFSIRDDVGTIDVEFATPSVSEVAARQRTVDALLADGWSEAGDGAFRREAGAESLTGQLIQTRFRDNTLEEQFTISAERR